jgi:hypothetical protein
MSRHIRLRPVSMAMAMATAAAALAVAGASCIKEKDSLVIVAMTAEMDIPGPFQVHVTVGNVTQTFDLAAGLSAMTPTQRGVYLDSKETGNIVVTATAQAGMNPCVIYSAVPATTVKIPSAGSTVTASINLVHTGFCGGTSDAGTGGAGAGGSTVDAGGDHPGTGGTGTGGGPGSGGSMGMGGKGGAAGTGAGGTGVGGTSVGGAGGAVVVAPPSLSRCFEIRHTDVTCDTTQGVGFGDGNNEIFSVVFSPDGKLLLSAGDDGRIRFWKVGTGSAAPTVDGRELSTFGQAYMAFSHNGQYLAAGDFSGTVTVWSMSNTPTIYATLTGHSQGVDSVWFSPDDTHLVSVGDDMQLIVWSMATRTSVATVPLSDIPWWVRVSPLATATALPVVVTQDDGTFVLMNALATAPTKLATMVSNNIDSGHIVAEGVAYSPDGRSLLLGSQDGSLSLWTGIATNQPTRTAPDFIVADTLGNNQAVKAAAFFPDGLHVASASGTSSNGGHLSVFETTTKRQIATKVPTYYFLSLDVSPDGGGIAAGEVECGLVMYCHD